MRARVIWNVIKDDWYSHRWMFFGCLFIPLLLEVLAMWQGELIYGWFQDILGVKRMTVSMTFGVLCVYVPYMLLYFSAVTRLASEADAGFYKLARTLPIMAEEVVTARFISSFILSVGGMVWFALLLGIYGQRFGQPMELWTALYLTTFLFPVGLAIHHGLFFRSGTKGSTGAVFLFILLIIGARTNVAEQGIQTFDSIMHDFPVATVGIGALLLIVIWLLCWRWAMTTYRKYLEGTSKSAKKRRTRGAVE